MNDTQACAKIKKEKLVAILRGVPNEKTLPLVEALHRGGVRILEFTFDHGHPAYLENTLEKLRIVRQGFGNDLTLGCGTVLSVEEADAAISSGAELVISPHTDAEVIAYTKKRNAVSIPGALTPTEIVAAHRAGADFVKLFPAGELGLNYMRAVRAPLHHIPLMPVGGVTPESVPAFLDAGAAGFGIGGQLVEAAALKNNDYGRITACALAFTRAIADWEALHA